MSDELLWWTSVLAGLAVLNLSLWAASAFQLLRAGRDAGSDDPHCHRLHLWLSAGYVFGCAWRSWFPVFDVPRMVIVDAWHSSIVVGRSVATVAELCFAAQWVLLLRTLEARGPARTILPMIVVAELCSWHAVLTTSNLGHAIEESLWAMAALVFAYGLVRSAARVPASRRPLLAGAAVIALGYVVYMVGVDVPMYWARHLSEVALGHQPLDLVSGIADAAQRRVVSLHWEDWRGESVWMTLYFSVAVWLSLALVHARWVGMPAPSARSAAWVAARS